MAERAKVELRKGLKDVYFDRTTASLIVAKPGKLYYRGYNIDDLARYSTFEETCYLLIYGALPTASQLEGIDAELRANRGLPAEVVDTLRTYRNAHPMDALRGAVSAMALADPAPDDLTEEAVLKKALRMTSAVATMVAAHHRIRNGNEPVEPNSDPGPRGQLPLHAAWGGAQRRGRQAHRQGPGSYTRSTAVTRRPSRRAWPPRPAPTSTPR